MAAGGRRRPSRWATTVVPSRYAAVLATPGAPRATLSSSVGRLAAGMTDLSLILLVRRENGSYGLAGLTAAAFAVSVALLSPLRARWADRRGQVRVLLVSAAGFPAALALAAIAARSGDPAARALGVPAGAALAGALFPPFAPAMRAVWSRLADPGLRATAFAFEATSVEVSFVLGPLAVAGCAALSGPLLALAVSASCGGAGALLLARSPLVRAWVPEAVAERHPLGPLRSRHVRVLVLTVLVVGFAFGSISVGVPAFAEHRHALSTSGALLSVWSLGSALSGLAYGSLAPVGEPDRRYRALGVLLAAGCVLPVLAWGLVPLAVLLLGFGMTIAPFFSVSSSLVADLAPAGTTTEAFAWVTTGIWGGAAAGNAVAGLAASAGDRGGLAASAGFGVLLLALVLTRRPPTPAGGRAGRNRSAVP